MVRIAFDIGGTFTDIVVDDRQRGRLATLKVPSTPGDPARAVLEALDTLSGEGAYRAGEVRAVLHATTVATNAVIERSGARTALITTAGFRDVLILGRQKRPETYDLHGLKPVPLVPRRRIFEVAERVGFDGRIIEPLDPGSLEAAIDAVLEAGAASVAVALLHGYANPAHEQAIGERLQARAPGLPVSLSSEVSPRYREYERTSTTVVNAYIQPLLATYLGDLKAALAERGFRHELSIMQSNGGLVSPELARRHPVRILESGPAAGVLMASATAAALGEGKIISFDMGGTTAKLGAVEGGRARIASSFEVDGRSNKPGSGLPVTVPSIELLEIGAGGGSIAALEMGMITVGPESAGARPGPICYGLGGEAPTVTDANVVLGYIDPDTRSSAIAIPSGSRARKAGPGWRRPVQAASHRSRLRD